MTFTQILLLAAAAAVVGERAEPTAHFILLATQRTGSTWVMSELSKHSSCIATGTELFLDHKGFTWTESSRVRCLKTLYGSDVDKKQKPHKCSPKFKQFRSEVRALQKKVKLETSGRWEMLRQLKNVKNAYSELGHLRDKARAAGLETRMVTYEDLSANATAFAQLANWLQGGGSKCPSALDTSREVDGPGARAVLKIHSKRLNETVLNWNVVVKTLTGTEFERFLHDDA